MIRNVTQKVKNIGSDVSHRKYLPSGGTALIALLALTTMATQPAAALDCNSDGIGTIMQFVAGILTLIPVAGVAGLAASFGVLSVATDKDTKKKWKGVRNQSLKYGVLGGVAIQTLLQAFLSLAGLEFTECMDTLFNTLNKQSGSVIVDAAVTLF